MSVEIFEKCSPSKNGIIIPGSSADSDLSASTGVIKNKSKHHLLSSQKLGHLIGDPKRNSYTVVHQIEMQQDINT